MRPVVRETLYYVTTSCYEWLVMPDHLNLRFISGFSANQARFVYDMLVRFSAGGTVTSEDALVSVSFYHSFLLYLN